MTFDNSLEPSRTSRSVVKTHLPLFALIGGGLALFVGLHSAGNVLTLLGLAHVVVGLALIAGRKIVATTSNRAGGGRT